MHIIETLQRVETLLYQPRQSDDILLQTLAPFYSTAMKDVGSTLPGKSDMPSRHSQCENKHMEIEGKGGGHDNRPTASAPRHREVPAPEAA